MTTALLLPLGLGLLAVPALFLDLPMANWIASGGMSHWPGGIKKLIELSEVFAKGESVAVILLAAIVLDPRGVRLLPRLIGASGGAGLLADLIKLGIARQRPRIADLNGAVGETFQPWTAALRASDLQSFPSAHAATTVGLALGLSYFFPRGCWLFAALALLACLQRIECQAHFPSDVLCGAAIGALVGTICTQNQFLGRWFARCDIFPTPPTH